MPRTKYTHAVLAPLVKQSRSVSEVLLKLGLRITGGAHAHVKRRLIALHIDVSHFQGKRANSGDRHRGGPAKKTAAELLVLRRVDQPRLEAYKVRRCLLEIGRAHTCEACGLGGHWNGKALVLQIDHINGLIHDYRLENLRFLCPNCHSQTATFGIRNRAYAEVAERQTPTA